MSGEGKGIETRSPKGSMPAASLRDIGTKTVNVNGQDWVFQQMLGTDLKKIERRARNLRTQQVDSDKLLRLWYESVVLGLADVSGNPMPDTVVPYDELAAPALNAFEAELSSFLGYSS
jgi:hypothetical protein